jgi:uncharacterized protein (DUF4213/DUF364 family)
MPVAWAQIISRRSAKELETRSKREETMRNLRWAADLAVSKDVAQAKLGLAQLNALGNSDMLDADQQRFIDAALAAVVKEPVAEIEAVGPEEAIVRVLEVSQEGGVPSEESEEGSDG